MNQTIVNTPAEPANSEMSMRYLAFFVYKKWRTTFIIMAVFVFIALLLSTMTLVKNLGKEKFVNQALDEYNELKLDYDDRIATLERDIAATEINLALQEAYNQNSLLMKIDPYQKMITTMTYYIDADEQVVPDYMDQYIVSRTDSLLKAYMLYLGGGDLYTQIMEQFPEIKDLEYFREIFNAAKFDSTGMITVSVIGSEEETVLAIMNLVRKGMEKVYTESTATIGEHRLMELESNTFTYQDSSLIEKQQKNTEAIFNYNIQLKEKGRSLETLKEEREKLSYTPLWRTIVEQFLFTAVYAALAGLFVSVIMLSLYYIMTDKILDTDKFRCVSGFGVLGKVPRSGKSRGKALDRAAAKFGDIRLSVSQRDDILVLTAKSICATMQARGIKEGSIALAGSIAAKDLQETADAFNQATSDSNYQFVVAGDPMRDIGSITTITSAEETVLVEKQGVSRCTDISKEATRILAWGKPVLGIVLLNTDAL